MRKERHICILTLLLLTLTVSRAQTTSWLWTKDAQGTGADEGWGISNDNNGNIYVTGNFWSSPLSFSGQILYSKGSCDFYIAKYTSSGFLSWVRSAGGNYFDYGKSVCCDPFGNVYATGYFQSGFIVFGSDTLTKPGNYAGFFIVKYDSFGNVLWAKLANGSNGNTFGYSVSADSMGNAYVTGNFDCTNVLFGTYSLTNTAGGQQADVFVAKYDSAGNVIWAKSAGGINTDFGYSISTNNAGVFVTGFYDSPTMAFGSSTLTNTNSSDDIFLVKYDFNGNVVWARSIGGNSIDRGYSLSADVFGNVYITGVFQSSSVSFGSYSVTNVGSGYLDFFLAKYDSLGNVLWAKSGGGNKDDQGFCVNADIFGNAYLIGGFVSTTISFGSAFLSAPAGSNDQMFIARYDSLGNPHCISALASGGDDFCGISSDKYGNAYVTSDYMVNPFIIGQDSLHLTGQENIFVSKYNCSTWAGIGSTKIQSSISAFPNPFTSSTILQTEAPLQNATIQIKNSLGQIVKEIKNISAKTISLQRDHLQGGLYFANLLQDNAPIATIKLVILNN